MELKKFQTDALNKLREYFEQARLSGDPKDAFLKVVRTRDGRIPWYNDAPGLKGVPYVCLRLPTGGGKTIVGAYAVRTAAASYIEKDYPVVLWLVPTEAIRTQTASALKNTTHPYRAALDDAFDGRIRVFDIDEIENIRPPDIAQSVCVIVATIQTLRVQKTANRDVYAHKEALEDHFTKASETIEGLERIAAGPNAGKVKYSFANLMFLHRPMVIVDEAHNARTKLSFEALSRVHPSCIVELTATPDTAPPHGSNVLYRVSASELKAEDMIKLPIVLTVHENSWQSAVADALRTRLRLAESAPGEKPDYVRPILLIQAENKDKPANVEAVKQYLLENEHIADDKVAVATGDQRELDDVNLFDPACPIEIIITVQALKEGWDCSFAYVFCSTATIHSSKDVEQLLGRVLRMPYASRRKAKELNKAYAHVSSPDFFAAAKELETSLIEMGFEDAEAKLAIEPAQPSIPNVSLFLQRDPLVLSAERAPDLEGLSEREQQAVVVTPAPAGGVTIELHGPVTPEVQHRVLAAVPSPEREAVAKKIEEHNVAHPELLAPSQLGKSLIVPKLCVRIDDEWLPFDSDVLSEAAAWDLTQCSAGMDDVRFDEASKTFEFDIADGRVTCKLTGEQQLDLNLLVANWTQADLIRWMDKEIRNEFVAQERLQKWLDAAITNLLDRQRMTLATLVRGKFILARNLEDKIRKCRLAAYSTCYQQLLFESGAVVGFSPAHNFEFLPDRYFPHWPYEGRYRFQKHFYPYPGELRSEGEEFECAKALDAQSGVKYWVRNLANQPESSMWLQTSTDRFYPDFVAELNDGRILVVEYKGEGWSDNPDTREKRRLGELWQENSGGKALFLIAEKRDDQGRGPYDQIKAKIGAA